MIETPRPYYNDPLAAAWMAKHHGMRFLKWKWSDLSFQFIPSGSDKDPDSLKLYIHPDSLHLLEPQFGDIGVNNDGCVGVYRITYYRKGDAEKLMPEINQPAGFYADVAFIGKAKITQRKGIAFMWPQS